MYIFNRSGAYFGSPNGGTPPNIRRKENAILRSPAAEGNGKFGASVDSYDNWIIVGAPNENSQDGAAYVFNATTQALSAELFDPSPDGSNNDYFGTSVAIHGDYCAVGAYGYGLNVGRVVVYRWSGLAWEYLSSLSPLETTGSSFGFSLDMSDEFLVVGAPIEDVGADNTGSVYLYERRGDEFAFRTRITGSASDDGDQLGFSVSIAGDLINAGTPFYDGPGTSSGRTLVFRCQ